MYKLKNKIVAHGSDVRTMSVINQNQILTGSRDSSCKLFNREEGSNEFVVAHTVTTDRKYVNSCRCFKLDDRRYYIVGTGLSVLYVYDGDNFELVYTLEGHSQNVSCIDCCYRRNHIASGSWDCTINVWDMNLSGKLVDTLRGHEQAVWCVRYVPGFNLLLSGSADKTIRLWKNYSHVKTFTGHTHAVRDIIVLEDKRTFLSCGNDMTIIKWDIINGIALQTIGKHTSFIYSLASIGNGDFVSAGEDGELIVWRDMKKFQEIKVPCTSVWKIDPLNDQELAVACSDGVIRIYTNDEAFVETITDEPQETTTAHNATVDTKTNYPADSNDKIANARALEDDPNIPDASIGLAIPGTKDGQVTLVRNQGKVQVYEWSVGENRWTPFGDVLSDNQSVSNAHNISKKIYFEGKEYDYVFDVDLEGQRMLKLPYNDGDDEWEVARKWLAKHNLNAVYTEQIVNFIKTNAIHKPTSPPIATPAQLTYTLHKFKATNMAGLYRKLLEISSLADISNEHISEIKSNAERVLDCTDEHPSLGHHRVNNINSQNNVITETFPWEMFYGVINGEHNVNVVPFLDLLRVFSLDYEFTRKYIQDNQINQLTHRYVLNDGTFDPVAVMLVLKSLCNMIFLQTNQTHCTLVTFLVEHPDSFSCFNHALLWLTQRCHVALSTWIYNLIVYFYYTTNSNDCFDLFHQTVHCLLEGFRLTECTFDDESLLRLFTATKILAYSKDKFMLNSEEKLKFNQILKVFLDRKPTNTDLYHPNTDISALIVELTNIFEC